MVLISSIAALALALVVATVDAAPAIEKRATTNFALAISGGNFDINYLQTFNLYYANSSAYLGEIKYQIYSEPLIVSGAGISVGFGNGLTFESIHSPATGTQEIYIVPHQTKPIGFSVPHGTPPSGVRTTGFAFNGAGHLTNNGNNLFYACQNAKEAAINSYQIWWWGNGRPNGVSCKGPLGIQQIDTLAVLR